MLMRHPFGIPLSALLLLFLCRLPMMSAADKDAEKLEGKVAGILIEKKREWIVVKVDGEDESAKFLVDVSEKRLAEALRGIFDACRVQLTYKNDGSERRLVGIKRQVLKTSGAVTGEVVKVHNNFWVEVKPKTGYSDAYAPGADNWNNKDFMEKLKGLKKGDSVTITFTTDFERHRIKTLRINPSSQPEPAGSSSATPPK